MCPTQLLIKPCSTLKVHWRLSATLKTTNKYVWSNTFWYAEVNISWEFVQCTIHWDKTQILKKFLRAKGTFQIMHSFFFRELQLITVLLLICVFYMRWSKMFISLKVCVGFSIVVSISFLLTIIYLLNTKHGLFDLNIIISFKIKIIEKPPTFLLPDLLIFDCKKKFETSVISAWLEDELFKLRKSLFWVRYFY